MDYRLEIEKIRTAVRIEASHAFAQYRLLTLHGKKAALFLDSGVLPLRYRKTGSYRCNKTMIWHLLLASVAIKDTESHVMSSAEGFYLSISEQLSTKLCQGEIKRSYSDSAMSLFQRKLRRASNRLSFEEYAVATTLFEHHETHLSKNDIEVLFLLKPLHLDSRAIGRALHQLVKEKLIQLIQVTNEIQFYDVNTQPHAHIYCEQTDQLFDAEIEGCVLLKEKEKEKRVRIQVSKETSHSLSVKMSGY